MSEQAESNVPTWTLGWRLKRALAAADIPAADMAHYLGYSKAQLSRYMHDKGEPPRAQTVRLWAMRCGVDYQWLADGTEPGPRPEGEPASLSTKW